MQTRSQAKSSGVKVPEVYGIEKSLVLHVKPERQKVVKLPTDKRLSIPKPRIGQGKVEIRRKARVVPPLQMSMQTAVPKGIQSLYMKGCFSFCLISCNLNIFSKTVQ